MSHTPHDYTDYDSFEAFDALEQETSTARQRLAVLQNSRTAAWALARDYAGAGGNPHHLIDAIQAFMNGEPEPPVGPPPTDHEPDPDPVDVEEPGDAGDATPTD